MPHVVMDAIPWRRSPLRATNNYTNASDEMSKPSPRLPSPRLPQAPVFVRRGPVARARRMRRTSLEVEPAPDSPLPTSPVSSGTDVRLSTFSDRVCASDLSPESSHVEHAVFTKIDTTVEPSDEQFTIFTEIETALNIANIPSKAPPFPEMEIVFSEAAVNESLASSSAATCVVHSNTSFFVEETELEHSFREATRADDEVLDKSCYASKGNDPFDLHIDGAEVVSDEEDVEIRSHGSHHAAIPTKDGNGQLIFSRNPDDPDGRLLTRESLLVDRQEHFLAATSEDRETESQQPCTASKTPTSEKRPRRRLHFPLRLRHRAQATPTPHRFADLPEDETDFFDAEPPRPMAEVDDTSSCKRSGRISIAENAARKLSLGVRIRAHRAQHATKDEEDRVESRAPRRRFNWFRPRVTPNSKALVASVSLAKDDFIEFATSTAQTQRRPWFLRSVAGPAVVPPTVTRVPSLIIRGPAFPYRPSAFPMIEAAPPVSPVAPGIGKEMKWLDTEQVAQLIF